jgi:hypothetical protein
MMIAQIVVASLIQFAGAPLYKYDEAAAGVRGRRLKRLVYYYNEAAMVGFPCCPIIAVSRIRTSG